MLRSVSSGKSRVWTRSGIFGDMVAPEESEYRNETLFFIDDDLTHINNHRRPEDVVKRLDGLIAAIREKYHKPESGESVSGVKHADILIVAHGHILRAFALRWVGKPLSEGAFILEAGGVGTLR